MLSEDCFASTEASSWLRYRPRLLKSSITVLPKGVNKSGQKDRNLLHKNYQRKARSLLLGKNHLRVQPRAGCAFSWASDNR